MHIFLKGPLRVGKSTIIRRTLALLDPQQKLPVAGFCTCRGEDGHIYMRAAASAVLDEQTRIAYRDEDGLHFDLQTFESLGLQLLQEPPCPAIIIADELGFMESEAHRFQARLLDCLDGDVPLLGVLRDAPIAWHQPILSHPSVQIRRVDPTNRDALPGQLAGHFRPLLRERSGR